MKIALGGYGLGAWLALAPLVALAQSNDKAQANAYDDAWKSAWVSHCRTIYSTSGKTAGFVLEIGDSITHANPYAQWPRQGTSAASSDSPDDGAIFSWANTTAWNFSSNTDVTVKNGWYLAAADTSVDRGMTASGGIEAVEYVSGDGNGGAAMPSTANPATAQTELADGSTYPNNLQISTVTAAFGDAQVAVVMLGTNDTRNRVTDADYLATLTSIVATLEGQNIVVILSTIPPSTLFDVTGRNAQIRSFAESHSLPLIDFYREILVRQPANWSTTLISSDGVHPSADGTGSGGTAYTSASDPYANGGNPATNATGEACTLVGYLLRSWLTVQKLKELKSYVVDGVNPPPPPPPPPTSGGGGGGGGGGGCGATGLEAALALLLGSATRRARKAPDFS